MMRVDAVHLHKHPVGYHYSPVAQFQKDGHMAYLFGADLESEKYLTKWCDMKRYKTPAELRKN